MCDPRLPASGGSLPSAGPGPGWEVSEGREVHRPLEARRLVSPPHPDPLTPGFQNTPFLPCGGAGLPRACPQPRMSQALASAPPAGWAGGSLATLWSAPGSPAVTGGPQEALRPHTHCSVAQTRSSAGPRLPAGPSQPTVVPGPFIFYALVGHTGSLCALARASRRPAAHACWQRGVDHPGAHPGSLVWGHFCALSFLHHLVLLLLLL